MVDDCGQVFNNSVCELGALLKLEPNFIIFSGTGKMNGLLNGGALL